MQRQELVARGLRLSIGALVTGFIGIAGTVAYTGHDRGQPLLAACGPGAIAFRAPPAHEKGFSCEEGSWYDGGYRDYIAHLSEPLDAHRATVVLVHQQAGNNGARSGVLLTQSMRIRSPRSLTLKGRIDFSSVYSVSPPAGAPPFGIYTLTIYRGRPGNGRPLARGTFRVIED